MLVATSTSPAFACVPPPPESVASGPRTARQVALTFDDGPSRFTPQVLRILRRHRAHATFFVVGSQIRGRRRTLRQMVSAGHEIANHTYTHPHLAPDGTDSVWEIQAAQVAVQQATGVTPCLFRPPYLSLSSEIVRATASLGLWTVSADVLSNDWVGSSTPAAIARRVVDDVRPGSIVLLHDGLRPRPATVAALSPIIVALQRRGYRLVTASRVLGSG